MVRDATDPKFKDRKKAAGPWFPQGPAMRSGAAGKPSSVPPVVSARTS